MPRKRPSVAAHELLNRIGVEHPPVDVLRAAEILGAQVVSRKLQPETSGMLVRDSGVTVIGLNSSHHEVRRRFSVAHELGHLLLHPGRPLLLHETVRVNFRDATSSTATDTEEIEANAFAAELLMPEEMVRDQVARAGRPTDRRQFVHRLSETFAVSKQAMEIRLVNLGVLLPE